MPRDSELDQFLAELLRQIPESTNTEGVENAELRIFSSPAAASEKEICAEGGCTWNRNCGVSFVRPRNGRGRLAAAEREHATFANATLAHPHENAEAWLNALNQAVSLGREI